MKCLVTKLKATVNNPNLPIFETMQQFTLNAIAASGNSSMTNAQKYALNHAFYMLGAIDNTELWQKIDYLFLPTIGASLDYFRYDYKNSVNSLDTISTERFTDTHGGLEALSNSQWVNFANTNTRVNSERGALFASLLNGYSEPLGVDIRLSYSDNVDFHLYASNGSIYSQAGALSGQNYNLRDNNGTYNSILVNVKGAPYSLSTVDGIMGDVAGNTVKVTNEYSSGSYVDTTSKTISYIRMFIDSSKPVGIIALFGAALTDAEISKVFAAAKALNDAFTHE